MKLYRCLFIILFAIIWRGTTAQSYQKEYINADVEFLYNSLTTLSDTGVAIANLIYRPGIPSIVLHILKLDKQGGIQNETAIKTKLTPQQETTGSQYPCIIEGENKTLTVSYNSAGTSNIKSNGQKIFQLDSNLHLNWSVNMPGGNMMQNANLVSINNKYYSAVSYTGDSMDASHNNHFKSGLAVCGITNNGNSIFAKKYFGSYTFLPPYLSISKNNNQNLLICSQIGGPDTVIQNNYLRGCILELDTLGSIIHCKYFPNTFINSIIQDSNNNYLIMGLIVINDTSRYFMSLTDEKFYPLWTKYIDNFEASDRISALIDHNEIYVYCKYENQANLALIITKINYQGTPIESYFSNYPSSTYYSFSKSKNGQYITGDLLLDSFKRNYIIRACDSINSSTFCPLLTICNPAMTSMQLETHDITCTVLPHIIDTIEMVETATQTIATDYCNPTGTVNGAFVLAKDTFCIGEAFDLRSFPTLLSGTSEWIISGPENMQVNKLDTLGIALFTPGTYTITHYHNIAWCRDGLTLKLVLIGPPPNLDITTCDTVFDTDVSNCPFVWPDSSTHDFYLPTTNEVLNIETKCEGCAGNTQVNISLLPKPHLVEPLVEICDGTELNYSIPNTIATNAIWLDGYIGLSRNFDSSGTYIVQLSNSSCTLIDTLQIQSIDCRTCNVYIPNAFTPNGDGNNDVFKPYTSCDQIIQYQLQIYNRWGEMVYESMDIADGWDGRYKSESAPESVYVYIMHLTYNTGSKISTDEYKGSLTLMR